MPISSHKLLKIYCDGCSSNINEQAASALYRIKAIETANGFSSKFGENFIDHCVEKPEECKKAKKLFEE